METDMKVIVNLALCDGHGTCVDACPEVFALSDDDDVVTVLDAEPGEELRESVDRAARLCPKAAITLDDESSS
jgi:ferredoxin